ncbi:MAG: hypothetical protein NC218_00635 [Acetobacter sp.]|nr:hypothetical protein [Acetobacter sp.]
MSEENNEAQFSPILIMEFIRQVTVAHYLNGKPMEEPVRFKLVKSYYDEIKAYELQVQFIRLYDEYNVATEVLSVKTDDVLINRFKEQKSLVEIAGKYEAQYAERYKKFIEVMAE